MPLSRTDTMHSPIQVAYPHWNDRYVLDATLTWLEQQPEAAAQPLAVDGANWQRRAMLQPEFVPVRTQLGKGPYRHAALLKDFRYLALQHGPRRAGWRKYLRHLGSLDVT